MRTSDSVEELYAALVEAEAEFEAVDRTANNPFFKSAYADLPAVVKAVSPILGKYGLGVTHGIEWDGEHDLLTTRVIHKSGQWQESTGRLMLPQDSPQGQGSATTYGRRYSFSAALNIVTEVDDDGNHATQSYSAPNPRNSAPHPGHENATGSPLFLDVPFKDKEAVKKLGARWDAGRKQWYVPANLDAAPFAQWMEHAADREPPAGDEPPPYDEEPF